MHKVLVYSFPGEIDDLSHLFPNERLAQIAAVVRAAGAKVEIWDRADLGTLAAMGPRWWTRMLARFPAAYIFSRLAEKKPVSRLAQILCGLPLKLALSAMAAQVESNYRAFIRREARRIADGGFSMILLNVWRGGFRHTMELARLTKQLRDVRIYATGQRVDWAREHVLDLYPQVDGLILGLGYDSIRRLAIGEDPETLSRVATRNKVPAATDSLAPEDVTRIPEPCYDTAVYHGLDGLFPLIHVTLSNQACPNECAFCVRPANYGRHVIRKAVTRVVDEIERHMSAGIRHFRIADSTPPPQALTELAREIVARGLQRQGIRLTAFARVDSNRNEDFRLLKSANFMSLFFGIETLDDDGLKRACKGITYDQIRKTLRGASKAGLFVIGSVIYPMPGETASSRARTLQRLNELSMYLDSVLIQPAGVYPASPWGKNPERYGIALHDDYIKRGVDYPVKFIVPMQFWPAFPFSYDLMDKPAGEVRFEDILGEFEKFSREVHGSLSTSDVQDYSLLVAGMIGKDPFELTDALKRILVTRDYAALSAMLRLAQNTTAVAERAARLVFSSSGAEDASAGENLNP
ncbi:MAG: hypothetical protein C0404_12595, partial [Verrucomicrobia bacterium]|nr:hypothetical protein [Verrucomicrobiota bacterium]